ncbi:MAG: ABC transporter permease [Ruminiclostridium sp.]|nr:ABC transporter permease [Ruminiclostridium sp.]
MKKYIETIKIMFKSQMAYRFDIFISMVFSVSKIILAYVLWGAIFSTKDEVAGFTFNGMISYYIISSFIAQLNQSSSAGWQISAEIRQGLFSKYMVRPMNIFGYFTAHTAGTVLLLLIFNLAAAVLWTFLFGVKITLAGSFYDILLSVVLILLGLLFMMQLNYYIGILAFKFLDIGPFMMIKDNIIEFVAGSFIPLALLSDKILLVMRFLPFYYVSYLPTMLLLGRNGQEALTGVLVLAGWNIFFAVLNTISFRKLKYRYDGVGI